MDNFGARYDASSLGRFMTPDWAAKPTTVPYASFGDPQTLNLYTYVEMITGHCYGRRGRDRTCNHRFRKPVLYPIELRAP